MYRPDYKGGSIVNLMSSVGRALGWTSPYKPLRRLDVKKLTKSKNIVVLVLDGIGYDWIKRYGKNTLLNKHIKDIIDINK